MNEEIKPGDVVTDSGRYLTVKEYFKAGAAKVLFVKKNTLEYTGNAFVKVQTAEFQIIDLYINAVRKLY